MGTMIYRSRAPLRLGLAGGGTDVSPYSDLYGGAILNATVNLYAHATIEPRTDGKIVFEAIDSHTRFQGPAIEKLAIDQNLPLQKGAYNRIVSQFAKRPLSFTLTTALDVPSGSGLGTSSTLMVAILGAFKEWLNLPLGEYEIAHLAFEIEREDLGLVGGRQDQYAAAFGGVNFMEFYQDRVVVNPLRIKQQNLDELEFRLVLCYTNTLRSEAETIIRRQSQNAAEQKEEPLQAMHQLKEEARKMKEALLAGNLEEIGQILDFGWQNKKKMAAGISNERIEQIYETAKAAGAVGGKISGAGGGGFMIFYCQPDKRYQLMAALKNNGGEVWRYRFTPEGLTTWSR